MTRWNATATLPNLAASRPPRLSTSNTPANCPSPAPRPPPHNVRSSSRRRPTFASVQPSPLQPPPVVLSAPASPLPSSSRHGLLLQAPLPAGSARALRHPCRSARSRRPRRLQVRAVDTSRACCSSRAAADAFSFILEGLVLLTPFRPSSARRPPRSTPPSMLVRTDLAPAGHARSADRLHRATFQPD